MKCVCARSTQVILFVSDLRIMASRVHDRLVGLVCSLGVHYTSLFAGLLMELEWPYGDIPVWRISFRISIVRCQPFRTVGTRDESIHTAYCVSYYLKLIAVPNRPSVLSPKTNREYGI
jgi:hypothetical protein